MVQDHEEKKFMLLDVLKKPKKEEKDKDESGSEKSGSDQKSGDESDKSSDFSDIEAEECICYAAATPDSL